MSLQCALRRWALGILVILSMTCQFAESAEAEFDFDVRSPSVLAIRRSLAERFILLKEHFQAGAIGLTDDGLVALREATGLVPEARASLKKLVDDDNQDRSTMYREIARANGRPDWESQFQRVFAKRWISHAPAGWYVRESGGQWVRKSESAVNGAPPAAGQATAPPPGN